METIAVQLVNTLSNVYSKDNAIVGFTDHLAVIVTPLPEKAHKLLSSKGQGVSHFDLQWRKDGLVRNPEGVLVAKSDYTKEGCRIMRIGQEVSGRHFLATHTVEIRTLSEHETITASEKLGHQLLGSMFEFCKMNPEHVEAERMIASRNQERLQLITFRDEYVSVWIPRKNVNDGNWLGYIHLDVVNMTFSYELYDELNDEFLSIPEIWDKLDIEKTEFFVQSLIDHPVLPRNINGMLY